MATERIVAGLACSQVLGLLSDHLDGELPPEARAQVDAHLAGCDVCARFGGEFGAALQALRAAAPPPDTGVFARLATRLHEGN
jgi:anti-sigma factor RsiW